MIINRAKKARVEKISTLACNLVHPHGNLYVARAL
jgi:hypothetical protein